MGTVGKPLPFQDAPESKPAPGNDHPAAEAGETKAETVQRLKLKVKVNGKEMEREFGNDELQLYVQKGLGADEKFQEAAGIRKTFAELQKALKENPFEALRDPAFGLDLEQIAIQHLAKKFEAEEMQKQDPRAYELKQAQEKLAKYEAQEKARQEEAQRKTQEEENRRMWEETEKSWTAELEKSGLGASKAYIRQMAEIGRDFLDAGLDLSPSLIVAEMKNRMAEQVRHVFGSLKGEQLLAALPPEMISEIVQTKVAALKATKAPPAPLEAPPAEKRAKSREEDGEPKLIRTYRDFIGEK